MGDLFFPPLLAGPRRAHFLRRSVRRERLRVGLERLEGEGGSLAPLTGRRALQRPPARNQLAASRGRGSQCHATPSRARGGGVGGSPSSPRLRPGTGAPRPRRDCQPERTVPSAHPSASRRSTGGERPTDRGVRGLRRCRQPTRPVLKHGPRSLTRARVRGSRSKPRGAMKVKAGARRPRWDPGGRGDPRRAHHRPVSPAPSGRWSRSARDRTRKMVNYAWAGRSQRKLWWRPAAVLTCKSVVRPGYRGERLIEPSSSWFLPKSPSGQQALGVPPVLSGKAND